MAIFKSCPTLIITHRLLAYFKPKTSTLEVGWLVNAFHLMVVEVVRECRTLAQKLPVGPAPGL